jgi:hypothetical protein
VKLDQLERTVIVACMAVLLLATADGIGMTSVCPRSGPGSCSDRASTNERPTFATAATSVPRQPSDGFAALLALCPWNERAPDAQLRLTLSVPLTPPSQQGISCPIEAGGYVAKVTSRLGVPAKHEANDRER